MLANKLKCSRQHVGFWQQHKRKKTVFWSDLASSYYAESVTSYLDAKKLKYVKKLENPANVPEARPIEDFWADLKRQVYKANWQAKDLKQLQGRIERELKKYPIINLRARMAEILGRLNKIAREGLNMK